MGKILIGAIVTIATGVVLAAFNYWLGRRSDQRQKAAEDAERREAATRARLWDPTGKSPTEIRSELMAARRLQDELRTGVEPPPPRAAPLARLAVAILIIGALAAIAFLVARLFS
jgi:hypothetical protein